MGRGKSKVKGKFEGEGIRRRNTRRTKVRATLRGQEDAEDEVVKVVIGRMSV